MKKWMIIFGLLLLSGCITLQAEERRNFLQGPPVDNFHWPFSVVKGEAITEEQCQKLAGHYWSEDETHIVSVFYGLENGARIRMCRLCGKRQLGKIPKEEIQWEDLKP